MTCLKTTLPCNTADAFKRESEQENKHARAREQASERERGGKEQAAAGRKVHLHRRDSVIQKRAATSRTCHDHGGPGAEKEGEHGPEAADEVGVDGGQVRPLAAGILSHKQVDIAERELRAPTHVLEGARSRRRRVRVHGHA